MLFSEIALYQLLEYSEIPSSSSSRANKDSNILILHCCCRRHKTEAQIWTCSSQEQGRNSGRQEKPHCSFVGHLSSLFGSLF